MKTSSIKIILLDLDGTLLNSQKKISAANFDALQQAAQNGVHIVPCTGRFFRGMPQVVRELPFIRYAITINGAEVLDIPENKVLYNAEIDASRADEVFALLDTLPVIYDCFQDGWGWMERSMQERAAQYVSSQHTLDMIQNLRDGVEDFRDVMRKRGRGVQKIQMFFADMEVRAQSFPMLTQALPDLVVTSSIVNNIEINSPLAQKGLALHALCQALDVSIEQTMAFGDGLNDISMLQAASLGIAMGNADADVKAAADFLTDSNDCDGVATALKAFGVI